MNIEGQPTRKLGDMIEYQAKYIDSVSLSLQ